MRVIVIGAGPAGMMAAYSASKNGNEVILIEKNEKIGKKLLITGKGRCNVTSSLPMSEFINNVPGNGKFLYSSFQNFTNEDIIKILKEHGLDVKEERGHRYFPVTDKSEDVRRVFEKLLNENKVRILFNSSVKKILVDNSENEDKKKVIGVQLVDGKKILADKVIVATGGKSYSTTGSTGDGYEFAKSLGHTITKIRPSLIPLTTIKRDLYICKSMQGLNLKNVRIKLIDSEKNKTIYEDFGEMLFTHFGVSGPTILSSSAYLLRYKNVEELLKNGKIILSIDLKPALDEKKLDLRILRDFDSQKNKEFKNSLNGLLPQKMRDVFVELTGIMPNKEVNSISKEERREIVRLLKDFRITISGFRGIEEAIITAGGINVKEINPKTMESKIVEGLYFAGEVIDVDAYTGGFNLQIAYSTGYTAGLLE